MLCKAYLGRRLDAIENLNVALEYIWDFSVAYYQMLAGANAALYNVGYTQMLVGTGTSSCTDSVTYC